MTDKQIIIDGVDVSGCEKQGETIAGITCGNGERIRLANEIITKHRLCKDNPNCIYKKYKRKEQECEELERLIAKQKNAKIQLSKLKDKQYKEFCDMKQTLIEIKEIAEKENNDTKVLYNRRTYQKMKQILQKINEVLNGTNS